MKPTDTGADDKVSITLSRAEALVLFEFLSRYSDGRRLAVEHPAEERVLWDIQCDLERALHEPIAHDYAERLEKARESICDPGTSKA